jgi:hypothetical protein
MRLVKNAMIIRHEKIRNILDKILGNDNDFMEDEELNTRNNFYIATLSYVFN